MSYIDRLDATLGHALQLRDEIIARQPPVHVGLLHDDAIAEAEQALASVKPKRKKPAQLTPLSLKLLRADGYKVEVVEHWNSFVRIRQDLFGFIDILALGNDETVAVQCCARHHIADRRNKIADHENVGAVRKAGWRILIHGWDKDARGRWRVKVEDVS